jgi:hypothetical protein
MSHRAAAAIGIRGMQPVTIRILPEGYEDRWAAQETLFDSVRSRLSPNAPPAPSNKAQGGATQRAADDKATGAGTDSYNLLLGIAATHGEVYTQTRRLPANYRDRVNVEAIEGCDSLRITLNVRSTKKEAQQLSRTLRNTFPKVQLIPAE